MKFGGHPFKAIRRRFLWLPKRISVIEGEYVPVKGATLIPFTPGFHHGHPPSGYAGSGKRKNLTIGGLVAAPVIWSTELIYDGWYWLEWIVEEYRVCEHRSDEVTTKWVPVIPRKQWNIFFEYE